jgi:hypothetical protein
MLRLQRSFAGIHALPSPCPILALGVAVDLVASAVKATEGGASLFIPDGHGPGAGIVPPPGFYFANDFLGSAQGLCNKLRQTGQIRNNTFRRCGLLSSDAR